MSEVENFTEAAYLDLLDKAKSKYWFNGSDIDSNSPTICWRHDIDYSPHRALSMAKHESERGLRCVYHVLCSSRYYNVLEPEISLILKSISNLGHEIGLHIDLDVLNSNEIKRSELLKRIKLEKVILENIINNNLVSISFHNHVLNIKNIIDEPFIEGLLNLASPSFYESAKYISDSNGIWRYETLESVLNGPVLRKLHVLTHPVWWPPESLTPIERVMRVINGRAKANKLVYIKTMQRDGRLEKIAKIIGLTDEDLVNAGLNKNINS